MNQLPSFLRPLTNRLIKRYLDHKFSDEPIIVGGPPRSGTTLLLSLLGSHPRIYAIDYETTAFHPTQRSEKLFSAIYFENESRIRRRIAPEKTRFAEKTPGNIRHAEEINDFFDGRVKIINIYRDVRDVLTSRHPLNPDQYWVPIERWIEDVKKGLGADRYENVFSIKYEDLVANTEDTIKEVCTFIGVKFDPCLLEYQKHTNVRKSLAWNDSAQAIHTASLRKWEKPEHAERLQTIMQNKEIKDLSRTMGYFF